MQLRLFAKHHYYFIYSSNVIKSVADESYKDETNSNYFATLLT